MSEQLETIVCDDGIERTVMTEEELYRRIAEAKTRYENGDKNVVLDLSLSYFEHGLDFKKVFSKSLSGCTNSDSKNLPVIAGSIIDLPYSIDFGSSYFNSYFICGDCTFLSIDFIGCYFAKSCYFNKCDFKTVNFSYGTFLAKCELDNVRFLEEVKFTSVLFKGIVVFEKVYFFNELTLNYACLEKGFFLRGCLFSLGYQCFSNIEFGEYGLMELEMASEQLKDKTNITFYNIKLLSERPTIIIDCKKIDFDVQVFFIDCSLSKNSICLRQCYLKRFAVEYFHYWLNFSFIHCVFPSVTIKCDPWFFKFSCLPDEMGYRMENIFCNKYSNDEQFSINRAQTYGELKRKLEAQGDSQLAGEMHFWQMYWQLKHNPKDFWKVIYLHTSAFGLSWRLPLFWLILQFVVFAYIYRLISSEIYSLFELTYFLYGAFFVIRPLIEFSFLNMCVGFLFIASFCLALSEFSVDFAASFLESKIKWSTAFTQSFLGFNLFNWSITPDMLKHGSEWTSLSLIVLFALQHVLSAYLLFQLGSAIRHRVRR